MTDDTEPYQPPVNLAAIDADMRRNAEIDAWPCRGGLRPGRYPGPATVFDLKAASDRADDRTRSRRLRWWLGIWFAVLAVDVCYVIASHFG